MDINKLLKLFILLVLVCNPYCSVIGGKLVKVTSQEQFDTAVKRINRGEKMRLKLNKGIYLLKEPIIAKAPLSISGKHATITSAINMALKDTLYSTNTHYIYHLDKRLSPFSLFFNKRGELLSVSEL